MSVFFFPLSVLQLLIFTVASESCGEKKKKESIQIGVSKQLSCQNQL